MPDQPGGQHGPECSEAAGGQRAGGAGAGHHLQVSVAGLPQRSAHGNKEDALSECSYRARQHLAPHAEALQHDTTWCCINTAVLLLATPRQEAV